MNLPRFHAPTAGPGARVLLPESSAHHAREVLRLRPGARVRVFDGAGHEFEAILETVSRREVRASLAGPAPSRPESSLRIVLALAPLKGDRMETAIQKATELGVAELRPVVTARTDAAARPSLLGSRQERWEKVASSAAEQCGRAVVPRIAPTTTLDGLLQAPLEETRLLLLETPGLPALPSLAKPVGAVLALIGPAGGWEPSESARLRAAGFHAVSLGPRILRAETAAIAAVACLQVLWGDLG